MIRFISIILIILLTFSFCTSFFIDNCYNNSLSDIYNKNSYYGIDKLYRTAGLFTEYALTPGGGESYFLTTAAIFHKMGFKVEISMFDENLCKSKECVGKTLKALRIPLSIDDISIKPIYIWDSEVIYDVFFIMGNHKFPLLDPVGDLNIYMCQFPFDLFRPGNEGRKVIWTKYDLVLVNSRFSFEWYLRTINSDIHKQIKQGLIPSLVVLYPPVQSYQGSGNTLSILPDKSSVTNIAVVGRFYRGRHNKGHDLALRLFEKVVKQALTPVRLHLIGILKYYLFFEF